MRPSLAIAGWALSFVVLAFLEAISRLGHRAIAMLAHGIGPVEWCVFVVTTIAFVYLEGHHALQRRFVPTVVARALAIACERPSGIELVLAPFRALSLFGAPRRDVLRAWASVAGIGFAIALVRTLPMPWRGIVDGAVAAALAWGLGALALHVVTSVSWSRSPS